MIDGFGINEWKVSGKVIYLKELQGEFAASIRLEGFSRREGAYTTSLLEFPCLMQSKVYNDAKIKGIAKHRILTISGHLESWKNGSSKSPKTMFIADNIVNIT